MPDTGYQDYPTYPLGATANGSSARTPRHHHNNNATEKHVLFFQPDAPQGDRASPKQQQQTVSAVK
jgi:hypothetical protein